VVAKLRLSRPPTVTAQVNDVVDGEAHGDSRLEGPRDSAGKHQTERAGVRTDSAGQSDPVSGKVRTAATTGTLLGQRVTANLEPPHSHQRITPQQAGPKGGKALIRASASGRDLNARNSAVTVIIFEAIGSRPVEGSKVVRRHRFVAAAAGLVLLAGACGSSKSSNSSASATGSSAGANSVANVKHVATPNPCTLDPGVTSSEIKVGVIAPQTGPQAASFSDSLSGIKARIDAANSSGETGSRRITLVVRDDAADQTKNLQQVRDLVENANVWALIQVSSASGGGAAYLNQHGIPVTGWHVGIPAWSIDANMFTFRLPTAADPGHVYNNRDATIMKKAGVTKIALIGGGNAPSVDFLTRNKKAIASIGGMKVVYDNETVPAGTSDFTAEAQAIKDSGADGLLTGMDFIPNTSLSAQLQKDGANLKEMQFPGGYDPRVLGLPGMEGAFFGLEVKPFESNPPAYGAFNAAMPAGAIRNQISYIGWLSGGILLQGIKDAGVSCPTRKAFINNLRLEHAYTGGGAFDPVDLQAGFGNEFACAYYVKVINKKFVPQFGGQQQCGDPIHF
jgi:ABC-type branched-subunit amino acid transport system substrate-binding protein